MMTRLFLVFVVAVSHQSMALNCTDSPLPSAITDRWTVNVCIASILLNGVQVAGVVGNVLASRWAYLLSHSQRVLKRKEKLAALRKEHKALRRQVINAVKELLSDVESYVAQRTSPITSDQELIDLLALAEATLVQSLDDQQPNMEEESTE